MNVIVRQIALLLVLVAPLLWSTAASALTQTRSPGYCGSFEGIGSQSWDNPRRAETSDDRRAITSLTGSETSNYLACIAYGFNIPEGATINGITVTVERHAESGGGGDFRDAAMRLLKSFSLSGADRATNTIYPSSDAEEAHGGPTDLWNTSWTPAQINDNRFGAAFAAQRTANGNNTRDLRIDHIEITVDYTVPCLPPPNTPAGLTVSCVCDNFGRTSLNPSTIFGGNWTLSNSDGLGNPYINQNTGLLRLTENTNNNAKAATVPGIFPAAGNYISVEFYHYAYNGTNSGADGIAVTLSDYSIPAVPGGFGGSLGYAQRNDGGRPPGFAGGWVGVALDEYGNYQNPTEGRVLGPGFRSQSVGIRGPGKGANGYRWIEGTASNPGGLTIDNRASTAPAPGYLYQVIVDATRSSNGVINVQVNRDTTNRDGTGYSPLFSQPINAYTEAAYALQQGWIDKILPDYWKVSFTGSTGGSTNIHEIGGLRICAQSVAPSTGGIASGFSVIDEAYPAGTNSTVPAYQNFLDGHIYMKLVGTSFKLWVAALTDSGISTAYSAGGSRYVSLKLVDNSDNACGTDAARTCNSSCFDKPAVESGGRQNIQFAASDPGAKLSSDFTLNSAWKNLVAVVRECETSTCTSFTSTAPACSADTFSVRPTGIASVISPNATNAGTTGAPMFKAGGDQFSLQATTIGAPNQASGYDGIMKINSANIIPADPGGGVTVVPGTLASASGTGEFPPATPGTSSSTSTGSFKYSEVGAFKILGPDFSRTPPRGFGVYDDTWSAVDSPASENDCVAGTNAAAYSNVKDANGKYGCNFGLLAETAWFGRFIPHHFQLSNGNILNRSELSGSCSPASIFTYMGEPFKVSFTLTAMNQAGSPTRNYVGPNAKLSTTNWLNFGDENSIGLGMIATDYPRSSGTCKAIFSDTSPYSTTFACTGVTNPSAITRTAGPRVAILGTPAAPAWNAGVASFAADAVLERADKPDGPYAKLNVGVAPVDQDGVRLAAVNLDVDNDGADDRGLVTTTQVRYGRMLISNAYGSELLPLPVPVRAQFWNGAGWVNNLFDNCTPLDKDNFTLAQGTGASITTTITGGEVMNKGYGVIGLTKPSNTVSGRGSVNLSTSITSPTVVPLDRYLPGKGVETFGMFKAGPVIYLRELY